MHRISQRFQSSLVRDSFWALFGNVANKGLALLAGIIIARFLGKELYGEYGLIKNTLLYIAVFSTFGLGFSSTKYVAQYRFTNRIRNIINASIIITLIFSSVMACCVFSGANLIARYMDAPEMSDTLKYTAITVIFNALTAAQTGILAGLHKFKETARNNSIVGFITFVASVVLTYYYGLNGAIIALMIANAVNCILNYVTTKQATKDLPTGGDNTPYKKTMAELVSFSFPIALQESTFSVQYLIGSVMLTQLAGFGELGLYSAAGQWSAVILFIPSALQNVTLSHLSGTAYGSTSHQSTFKTMIMVNLICTVIPFVCIAAASGLIVSLYGESYVGLRVVLIAMVFQTIIFCILQVYFQEFIATGRNWTIFTVRFIRDMLSLILSYILLISIDGYGALCFTGAHIFFNAVTLGVLYKIHNRNTHSSQ